MTEGSLYLFRPLFLFLAPNSACLLSQSGRSPLQQDRLTWY